MPSDNSDLRPQGGRTPQNSGSPGTSQSIARKTLLSSYVQVFNGVLGYLILFAVARSWGSFAPTALGIVSFGTAFVGMFSIISDLGFGNAHIKRVSEGQDLGRCLGTFAAIKLMLTGLWSLWSWPRFW